MATICGFVYSYKPNGGEKPICAFNVDLGEEGFVKYYGHNFYHSIPLISAELSRKTVNNIKEFSLGLVGNKASLKLGDFSSLFVDGLEPDNDGVKYENLFDFLGNSLDTIYVDFCIPKTSGYYVLNSYVIEDYKKNISTNILELQLQDDLLMAQNITVSMPLLKGVDTYNTNTLSTSENVWDSAISYYSHIMLNSVLMQSILVGDTESQSQFLSLVIPRPYHEKASLWNNLQSLCEAIGGALFQKNRFTYLEYSYLLR